MGALLAELGPAAARSPGNGCPATRGRAAAAEPEAPAAGRRRRRPRPASRPGAAPAAPAEAGDGVLMPIVLPDMESVTEGVVVEWRVAVGDAVAADQIVVEVSTDKVDLEVPAPAAGRLASIAVEAGGDLHAWASPWARSPPARGAAPARRPPPRRAEQARRRARRPGRPQRPAPGRRRRRVAADHPGRPAPGAGERASTRARSRAPGPAG